jgi:predicted nuclease of predicted toxin-antitoxin system
VIRFHLDEDVDPDVAHGLRLRGVDVTTAHDAGLLAASDEAHLEFALIERRVVVTHDADYLALAARGIQHAGIVYSPMSRRTIGEMVRYLALMCDCLEDDEMTGRVEFL